jgi:hypothetical protein
MAGASIEQLLGLASHQSSRATCVLRNVVVVAVSVTSCLKLSDGLAPFHSIRISRGIVVGPPAG